MDIDLENKVNEAIELLKQLSIGDIDFNEMDPVAKMLLVATLNEAQKIQDHVDSMSQRITERFCADFIPHDKICAIPAIAIINPVFKPQKGSDMMIVASDSIFSYKPEAGKHPLNYIPLFSTLMIPHSCLFSLTHSQLKYQNEVKKITMSHKNRLWIGITTPVEVECLKGLSLLIKGNAGVCPSHIYAGAEDEELDFATMRKMEDIEMLEPFDSQQSSCQHFAFIETWKERLLNMEDASLIYITDARTDRDLFKPRTFPNSFKQELEDGILNCFDPSTVWLKVDFPEGCSIPDDCQVIINALPVVNVDQNTLTLTQATPIAKLQKQDGAFFLNIVESSSSNIRQGFDTIGQDIIIRDFDAVRYNNGDLYRDVRNLYNRFIDDYYAFIEYNGIKDGEALKQLRQTINQIGKSVGTRNAKFKFDSGTYVMKNMNRENSSSTIKVTYLTTQGLIGNAPKAGETMDNKRLPAIEQKVAVVIPGMGGRDKASPDERYELLRYYSLTNDRLYTKMDIDAFLRKEIIAEFGREEFRRIFIKISIEGVGGETSLQRGLYIDIDFKDKKNYQKAIMMDFDKQLLQKIENKSCIAMPIIMNFHNLEGNENA